MPATGSPGVSATYQTLLVASRAAERAPDAVYSGRPPTQQPYSQREPGLRTLTEASAAQFSRAAALPHRCRWWLHDPLERVDWSMVVVPAVVAALVTLIVEYLAKPRLDARKERILEHERTKRRVISLLERATWSLRNLEVVGESLAGRSPPDATDRAIAEPYTGMSIDDLAKMGAQFQDSAARVSGEWKHDSQLHALLMAVGSMLRLLPMATHPVDDLSEHPNLTLVRDGIEPALTVLGTSRWAFRKRRKARQQAKAWLAMKMEEDEWTEGQAKDRQ